MMSIEIIIPDIGEGKFPIIELLVTKGDSVAKEDGLAVMESDKATMEVPAPADGVIESLSIKVGDEVATGDIIGTMTGETTSQIDSTTTASVPANNASAETPATIQTPTPVTRPATAQVTTQDQLNPEPVSDGKANHAVDAVIDAAAFKVAHASPSVRKMARELGVDLGKVSGTGRKGRITSDDVRQLVKAVMTRQTSGQIAGPGVAAISAIPIPDFAQFGQIESQQLSKINKLTGEHMTRCWLSIPHVTQHDEANITDLEAFRQSLKPEAEKRGVRVTMLSFLMKALVSAMKAYPRFNSSLSSDSGSLIMKQYYHIGIAVDTSNGLVVPVIRDVDSKSIYELSHDLMQISKKARDGKLTPADMSGGCMTISSLGGIGGRHFTPIVNAPEVAILGVSKAGIQPFWNGSEFIPRRLLPMSLSYDHRVIDGADGARFTQHLAVMLSDARRLLL